MAKLSTDAYIDGGLTAISGSTKLTVCAGQPVSFVDIAARELASSGVLTGGDFTIANGDTNGRKVTVAAQSSMSITTSGTADHVVVADGTDYTVTTCTGQALTSGGTVSTPTWDIEIADPV